MILRETQNQNDADDANDAESGIWYRDILKTASQASSASLSSRKDAAGGLGDTPENAFVDIQTLCLQNMSTPTTMAPTPDTRRFRIFSQSESLLIHPKILTQKSESTLIHFDIICLLWCKLHRSTSSQLGTKLIFRK